MVVWVRRMEIVNDIKHRWHAFLLPVTVLYECNGHINTTCIRPHLLCIIFADGDSIVERSGLITLLGDHIFWICISQMEQNPPTEHDIFGVS